jgi:DTW domain-containing protein YfiP
MGETEAARPYFTHRRKDWVPRQLHEDLRVSSHAALEGVGRQLCPGCGFSRALYCHTCLRALTAAPSVALPFNLWVLTHVQQNEATATGVHLAVLGAPRVTLLPVGELPTLNKATTVVLFPDSCALPAEEVEPDSVTDVIVVDSKWGQTNGIVQSAALQGVRHVRLGRYRTSYWRYHTRGVPEDGLCTVEAVYFLCRELHTKAHPHGECHCFDDLLWYFAHQHRTVHLVSAARNEAKLQLTAGAAPPRADKDGPSEYPQ